jgi:histone deacetylase complex regulatory component SIN3
MSIQLAEEFNQAFNFIIKVKARFGRDGFVYNYFLDILRMYHEGRINNSQVYQGIGFLFQSDSDLWEEFVNIMN